MLYVYAACSAVPVASILVLAVNFTQFQICMSVMYNTS